MTRVFTFPILVVAFSAASCDSSWDDNARLLSQTLPKDEVIGCFRAGDALPTLIVETDRILSDGKVIYSGYEYGLGGRNSRPLLVVHPRTTLEIDADGIYNFTPRNQSPGSSLSYEISRHPTTSIHIISLDNVEHAFSKVACG